MTQDMTYDLVVVGAGSGGMGAALTAGRKGMRVLWIDKESRLGGTGVNALVNVWQPSYDVSSLAPEIASRLIERGEAHYCGPTRETPSGRPLYVHWDGACYEDSLQRWRDPKGERTGALVVYTPEGMDTLLREMARETGRVDVLDQAVFLDAHLAEGAGGQRKITEILVQTLEDRQWIQAPRFVDATADIALARRAGCDWILGREAQSEYDEPMAPPRRELRLNGSTLCFLVRPGPDLLAAQPGCGHDGSWAHMGEMPDREAFYVNMCFQIPGEVGRAMGKEQAREYMIGNAWRRWPRVQTAYGLEGYGIQEFAPRIGVREGPRMIGRYVLTEHDVRRGNYGRHHDDCIAFCDHAMDSHLPGEGCTEPTNGPLGVPFRCLQPRDIDNLLVASRGASFSSLAASACRLQRTMMTLGEAAGHYMATGRLPRPALRPHPAAVL